MLLLKVSISWERFWNSGKIKVYKISLNKEHFWQTQNLLNLKHLIRPADVVVHQGHHLLANSPTLVNKATVVAIMG